MGCSTFLQQFVRLTETVYVFVFIESVQLSTKLAEIGLVNVIDKNLIKVATLGCAEELRSK